MKTKFFIFNCNIACYKFESVKAQDYPIVCTKEMPNTEGLDNILFTNDSKRILCFEYWSHKLSIYNIEGQLMQSNIFIDFSNAILTNDDSHIFGLNENEIAYFNLITDIDESHFEPNDTTLLAIDISKDEKYIVGIDKNSAIKVWDVQTGLIIREKNYMMTVKI